MRASTSRELALAILDGMPWLDGADRLRILDEEGARRWWSSNRLRGSDDGAPAARQALARHRRAAGELAAFSLSGARNSTIRGRI